MALGLPLLRAALLCERALYEADGTLSIIRVVHAAALPASGAGRPVRLTLVVMLERGEAPSGAHTLRLSIERPSGERVGHKQLELDLADGATAQSTNVVLDVTFEPREEGAHWFRVAWDDDDALLARVPFTAVD